jgi:class 3 adenylate cyclase
VYDAPVTKYAQSPDGVNIAYQIVGVSPLNVLFVAAHAIPLDLCWDEPSFRRFAARLGGFSRTVWLDVRGIGASGGDYADRVVDEVVDGDLTAVLDAVGCDTAVLIGSSHGGPDVIGYCVRHPKRVSALVLINTYAHYVREPDYPWGLPQDAVDRAEALSQASWGTAAVVDLEAPSRARDEGFRAWWARCERLGISTGQAGLGARNLRRDVRRLLPSVGVRTLVLHRQGDRSVRADTGRYLAEHIPGARYIELPGEDHLFFVGDADGLVDEIEEFLTGTRQGVEGDVVTATILFTDIVASTERSARLGHRPWSALAELHDAMVRAALRRYRGREIKAIGDGFLATFDATTRAVRAAIEIVTRARQLDLEVRVGIHTGEVELAPDDVVGLPVTIAKRICDLADPGAVFVSRPVRDLTLGTDLAFVDCGERTLKGVPGTWELFATQHS